MGEIVFIILKITVKRVLIALFLRKIRRYMYDFILIF